MMVEMNNAEKVTGFLRKNKGKPYCDDCLKQQVPLARRQEAQGIAQALATTPLFKRVEGKCSVCNKTKLVISKT
jgi:hypothetical protein